VSMQHALILEMCHMLFTPFIFVHRRLPRPSLSLPPSLAPSLSLSLSFSLSRSLFLSISPSRFSLSLSLPCAIFFSRYSDSLALSFLSLPLLTYSLPFTASPPRCLHAALPFSLLFLSGLLAAVSPRSYAVTRPLPPTFAKSLLVSLLGLSCIRYLVDPLLRFTRATLISLPSVSLFSFTLS